MNPESIVKLAAWMLQINNDLDEHDRQLDGIVDNLLDHSNLHSRMITLIEVQSARIAALEDRVEGFLRANEKKSAELDSEVAPDSAGRWCDKCGKHTSHHTDRHDEFVGNSTGPHVQIHPVDTYGIVEWDSAGEITRWFLQRLYERR